MALDPTLSEVAFRKSIKKFFVDSLYTVDGVYIDFDVVYSIPKRLGVEVEQWIVFHFDGLKFVNSVGHGKISAYLFSRDDIEGTKLATLRDQLMDKLVDENQPDGMTRVPLYEPTLTTQIGGMLVTTGDEPGQERADDGTKYKYINLYFTFGAK